MFSAEEQAYTTNMEVEQVDTTFSYRRQSTGSLTADTSQSDCTNALTLISDMLQTYNEMIQNNTNAIKENAAIRDGNAAMTRETLESLIEAINGIAKRTLHLEDSANKACNEVTKLKEETVAGNNMIVDSRLDDLNVRVQTNSRDIAALKLSTKSCKDKIISFEETLGRLEDRVSSIERFFMNPQKRCRNDMSAKTA